MLKRTSLVVAAVVLLQLPAGAVLADTVVPVAEQALSAQLDALIAPHYKANGPGASVLVTRNGKPVLRKAYGMANLEAKVAMQPDAVMRVGSITKQFTAVAIMLLVDEGMLSVTDPITKFFPDYPAHGKTITIEHLLTHTAGIPNYTSKRSFGTSMGRDMSVQQMVDSFKNDPLEFEPGTRYAYSNSGYFVLGAIIEKLSGQPYAKFIEQRIFVPLAMTHTAYEGHERAQGLRAVGYSKSWLGFKPATAISMTQPFSAGAIVSTVDDLGRWHQAIAAGKLLTPASWAKVHTSYKLADGKPTHYGYGWNVSTLRDLPSYAHGGDINGFAAYALSLPQEQVVVAVLSNADSGSANVTQLANKAAAIVAGKPYPVRSAVPVAPAALDALAGDYKMTPAMNRTIRRDGTNLAMERPGRPATTLYPFSPTEFFTPESTTVFRFLRNDKGVVDQLVLIDEERETVNPRVAR